MPSLPVIALGDAPLALADVIAVAHRRASVDLSRAGREAVQRGRAIVDALVDGGVPAYGITTGVGSQKDFGVSRTAIARYNDLMITGHATLAPGDNAPRPRRCARRSRSSSRCLPCGRSGVRLGLVESLLAPPAGRRPADRGAAGASVGASDIVAMSQMAVPLIGRAGAARAARARSRSTTRRQGGLVAPELQQPDAGAGGIGDRRSPRAARRGDARGRHLDGRVSRQPAVLDAAVDEARGQPGQLRTGTALAHGSGRQPAVAARARRAFCKTRLSFRCIPQIHGAAEAAYDFAHAIFESRACRHLRQSADRDRHGAFISHGNMETTACALAMDTLRQALAKVIEAAGQRIHKIQWPGFTGLPTSLAAEPGAIGGVQFLNFGHLAAADVGAVRQAALPAMLNYSGQLDDGVEDVAGNAPQSVAETARSPHAGLERGHHRSRLRGLGDPAPGAAAGGAGHGRPPLAAKILPMLPIGTEGEAIFDLGPLVEAVKAAGGYPAPSMVRIVPEV